MAANGAWPWGPTSECCGTGSVAPATVLLLRLPAVLSVLQLGCLGPSSTFLLLFCPILARRQVAKRCLWQRSCTVTADASVFGDPCKGKPKRLTFQYRQASDPQQRFHAAA